jgi:malonyl-CoA decarboxylase
MNASTWLSSKISHWRSSLKAGDAASVPSDQLEQSSYPSASKDKTAFERTTTQRLSATLKEKSEALSPQALRKLLKVLHSVVDPQLSEVEGARRSKALIAWYDTATSLERIDLWLLMSEQLGPDHQKVKAAREVYDEAQGTADEGTAEIRLRRALISDRTRVLQRIAAHELGMRFLIEMRSELLPQLKTRKRLLALDAELENLFSTWFDVAFLELRRISWDSPASLVEKLIKYEAVHDIRSWADLKNRLDSDRRCYGFFHPSLPNEPLIFVEVALLNEVADSITPLLDEMAAASDLPKAKVAIFYSISNTQNGLRGVSFGDSLIKRVVETLRAEFSQLKTFATLSPIPGLRSWLTRQAQAMIDLLGEKEQASLGRELNFHPPTAAHLLAAVENSGHVASLPETSMVKAFLTRCAAHYLAHERQSDQVLDPVAKFHLGNGACIDRLNWFADPSPKGHKQSYGLMVNYLYDLKRLDKNRHLLSLGTTPVSSSIKSLFF